MPVEIMYKELKAKYCAFIFVIQISLIRIEYLRG